MCPTPSLLIIYLKWRSPTQGDTSASEPWSMFLQAQPMGAALWLHCGCPELHFFRRLTTNFMCRLSTQINTILLLYTWSRIIYSKSRLNTPKPGFPSQTLTLSVHHLESWARLFSTGTWPPGTQSLSPAGWAELQVEPFEIKKTTTQKQENNITAMEIYTPLNESNKWWLTIKYPPP